MSKKPRKIIAMITVLAVCAGMTTVVFQSATSGDAAAIRAVKYTTYPKVS